MAFISSSASYYNDKKNSSYSSTSFAPLLGGLYGVVFQPDIIQEISEIFLTFALLQNALQFV